MSWTRHQYVERDTGHIRTERLYQDRVIRWLYCDARERAPWVFRLLTSRRVTRWFGWLNYAAALGARLTGNRDFLRDLAIDWAECLDPPQQLDTMRKVFQRRIRYWQCRPMPDDPRAVVSTSDGRCLVGS